MTEVVLAVDGGNSKTDLALVDSSGLSFYRTRCASLADLAGSPVQQEGRGPGALADVLVDPNGRVESLLVRDAHGSRIVPPDEATVGAHARSA